MSGVYGKMIEFEDRILCTEKVFLNELNLFNCLLNENCKVILEDENNKLIDKIKYIFKKFKEWVKEIIRKAKVLINRAKKYMSPDVSYKEEEVLEYIKNKDYEGIKQRIEYEIMSNPFFDINGSNSTGRECFSDIIIRICKQKCPEIFDEYDPSYEMLEYSNLSRKKEFAHDVCYFSRDNFSIERYEKLKRKYYSKSALYSIYDIYSFNLLCIDGYDALLSPVTFTKVSDNKNVTEDSLNKCKIKNDRSFSRFDRLIDKKNIDLSPVEDYISDNTHIFFKRKDLSKKEVTSIYSEQKNLLDKWFNCMSKIEKEIDQLEKRIISISNNIDMKAVLYDIEVEKKKLVICNNAIYVLTHIINLNKKIGDKLI